MPIGFCVKNYAIKIRFTVTHNSKKNSLRFQVSEAETSEKPKSVTS